MSAAITTYPREIPLFSLVRSSYPRVYILTIYRLPYGYVLSIHRSYPTEYLYSIQLDYPGEVFVVYNQVTLGLSFSMTIWGTFAPRGCRCYKACNTLERSPNRAYIERTLGISPYQLLFQDSLGIPPRLHITYGACMYPPQPLKAPRVVDEIGDPP